MASDEHLYAQSNHVSSLATYLPTSMKEKNINNTVTLYPHVTVTYATSLDSTIAIAPGTTTILSGSESKAMTHYLRAHHETILVGATTALTDDPRLTSRWANVNTTVNLLSRQPRPIVLDPSGRWLASLTGHENVLNLAREGLGHAPWVITDTRVVPKSEVLARLHSIGGKWLKLPLDYQGKHSGVDWRVILSELTRLGIKSIMVEGGATVINDLLRKKNRHYLSSLIVTIAPIYLGTGGVVISPQEDDVPDDKVYNLKEIKWIQMGNDVVMAALA